VRKKSLYDFILKIIKYLIVLLSLLFLLLLGLSVIISKFYSDQLKEMAVEQINSNLKTEYSCADQKTLMLELDLDRSELTRQLCFLPFCYSKTK